MTRREALDWLYQQADCIGECDRCHGEGKRLWALPHDIDSEPDAGWQYCADCFRVLVAKLLPSR